MAANLAKYEIIYEKLRTRGDSDPTWLAVIEPQNFALRPDRWRYPTFQFVFASTNSALRDRAGAFIKEILSIPITGKAEIKYRKELRRRIKYFLHRQSEVQNGDEFWRLLQIYVYLAQQSSPDVVHFRRGAALMNDDHLYLIKVGTEDMTTSGALDAFTRQMQVAPLAENHYALVTMLWFENE